MESTGDLAEYWDARVLVVDDLEAITGLLTVILMEAGITDVTAINDPREVQQHLVDYPPDLVLLDLHMPHVDGFELLEVIGRSAAGSYLPVLVLTGDTSPAAAHQALKLGAQDFLTKPLDPVEVVLRVRNLLRTRALHQQLRRSNIFLRGELEGLEIATTLDVAEREGRRRRASSLPASPSTWAQTFRGIASSSS